MKLPKTWLLVAATLLMAGCSGSTPELKFNGKGNGTHELAVGCATGTARLSGEGDIRSGQVMLKVTDSKKAVRVDQAFKGEDFEVGPLPIPGEPGNWLLEGTRLAGSQQFAGSYAFRLDC